MWCHGLSKLWCHVWSVLLLSPIMAPPPYFVYICLHAIPFSIYFGFNVGNLGKPRYLASSNFRNLPPLAKFSKFWGKFSICQIVRLTLANLLYYWSNFHCCKRPDTEKYLTVWSHCLRVTCCLMLTFDWISDQKRRRGDRAQVQAWGGGRGGWDDRHVVLQRRRDQGLREGLPHLRWNLCQALCTEVRVRPYQLRTLSRAIVSNVNFFL